MRFAIPLLVILVCSAAGHSATLHVPSDYPTIQMGIDSASVGDTVLVACGTYSEHDIVMKSGVCLRSQTGAADCVTIDGELLGRVITCEGVDASASLEGLTLTWGYATSPAPGNQGGGLYCSGSSPRVKNCVLSHNSASFGGGAICCRDGSIPSFAGCVMSDSWGRWFGGGLYCESGSSPSFTDCTFADNLAGPEGGQGGGASVWDDSFVSFSNVCFSGNSASMGGGMFVAWASAMLMDCTFSHNAANSHGGLSLHHASATLVGCTFQNNISGGAGGGLNCDNSSPLLTNCTFFGNSAASGGAISCFQSWMGTSHPIMESCILAFSSNGEAVWCQEWSTATLACCDIYGNSGGDWVGSIADQYGVNGNFSECPLFCDPESGDFHLQECSPCAPGNHPDGYDCALIGVLDVGCDCGLPSRVQSTTWSSLKALYR